MRSRLDKNISEAAYTGKAKDYADEFARISSAVRQLQREQPALHNVIDRLQSEEKRHWAIVLELHRVELALGKHRQKEEDDEQQQQLEDNHQQQHHHHHHHEQVESNDDDDVVDWHVLQRQRSELISKRSDVQESIMEVLDDV